MIEVRLRCDDCPEFCYSYNTVEQAKAAYDEHMAEMHPPDPRDEMIRQLIANLYPEACKQAWRAQAIAAGVKL